MKKLQHTPEGVRDIYNIECGKKLSLESRLHKVLQMYGYHDIQTPTFEFFEVFRKEIGTIPSKELYKFFDKLNDREYEVMSCVICDLLGADKISLTAPGNEGGVDFFARISFPQKAHFLFGTKGPIRIVGQCKKYANRDNVGHMKEFVTTMNNVYNKSYRAGEILPDWFKLEKGDIIGWHIANSGHQTGALDVAKNYGILVSDTKQLIEIICNSKIIRREKEPVKFLRSLMKEENYTY